MLVYASLAEMYLCLAPSWSLCDKKLIMSLASFFVSYKAEQNERITWHTSFEWFGVFIAHYSNNTCTCILVDITSKVTV